MIIDLCHNKIIELTVTDAFRRSVESVLVPKLSERYGTGLQKIQMYEDYLKDGFLEGGIQHYPLTVVVDGEPSTQWISWEVNGDFEDGVPYAYNGDGSIPFSLSDTAPEGYEEKLSGRSRYFEDGLIKISLSSPHPSKLFLAGRYSQTFVDEMARQLTAAILSAMSLESLGDGVIELSMPFAPETYMEHTSENVTYRRLLLHDKSSAPRDFWIKWTRLNSAQGYSVSDVVSSDSVKFELGEDVSQKIREKEYRFLLRTGKDKYHNSMGRKNITEWRELIKRAIKRGDLKKIELQVEDSATSLDIERQFADFLERAPKPTVAAATEISFDEAPINEIAPAGESEGDEVDEITRLALEALRGINENRPAEVVFPEEEAAEEDGSLELEEDDGSLELDGDEDGIVTFEDETEDEYAPKAEDDEADVEDSYESEDREEAESEDDGEYRNYEEYGEIEDEETLTEEYVDLDGEESGLPDDEYDEDSEDSEESEILAEEASLEGDADEAELSEVTEDEPAEAFVEPARAEESVEASAEESALAEEKVAPVSVNLDNYVTRDELIRSIREELHRSVRAELEAKIRLEYETAARLRAEEEAARLRRECEAARISLDKQELEVRRLEAERAEREEAMVAECEKLKAQLEFQLKRDSLERERVAEAARLALEEQKRLAGERQLVEDMKNEELDRLEREREAARIEEERRKEAERLEAERAARTESPEAAQSAADVDREPEYTYISKTVRLLFRRSVDPNVTSRIYEIIKATVEYYGKENVYMKIRATVPTTESVNLEFVRIPKEELELLGNIIKVLGNSGLGIAKAIVD